MFIRIINIFLALIMSFFISTDAPKLEASVNHDVTPETKDITITMTNKTINKVGDPKIENLEIKINNKWEEIAIMITDTEEYVLYKPFNKGSYSLNLSYNMGIEEPLLPGEYRIKISFVLLTSKNSNYYETYAYFTVS